MQNKAARIVSKIMRFDHIQPVLRELHWLPVEFRIKFKTLCFMYKCNNNISPTYLQDILHEYEPPRTLRSASQNNYSIPTYTTNTGYRAFSINGPTLWNTLPTDIKHSTTFSQFKSRLKTHLFKRAFNL